MKAFRYLAIIFSLSVLLLIQACGGGSSDTAGALTLSAATIVDNADGTATVTTTVTYSAPAGKTAQGVVVTLNVSDSLGTLYNVTHTFTSGSNSSIQSFLVTSSPATTHPVRIVASIGDMTSSILAVVPIAALPALAVATATVNFAATDAINTVKTVNISGGTTPYSISSTVPADISCTLPFGTFTGIMRATLLNANVGSVASVAACTVSDSAGGSVDVTVNYFK